MEPVEVMSVAEAARILHKRPEYLYKGLREGRFNFGVAVKVGSRWNYNIVKEKFLEYAGIKEEEDILDNLGEVSRLQTPKFVAYKLSKEVLKAKIGRKCQCDLCDKDVHEIWLVANNGDIYCDDCLRIYDSTLEGQDMDRAVVGKKVAHYNGLFRQ